MKNVKSRTTFTADPIMTKIGYRLVQDLLPDHKVLANRANTALSDGMPSYRALQWPNLEGLPPHSFKRVVQVRDFYKRYVFDKDASTPEQLSEKALNDFKESQNHFGLKQMTTLTKEVINEAANIVFDIIGSFDAEVFAPLCKWGRRAAVGLPLKESYLDLRCGAITGSRAQIEWLKAIRSSDVLLGLSWKHRLQNPCATDDNLALKITTVPKSYKSMRTIGPDTIAGGFLSAGLGRYLRLKLEENTHIKLDRAQDRHRALARQASIDGYHATIDMSKASDSFVWEHILALMPPSWHHILDVVRTPVADVNGQQVKLTSYMLMGSGHTFPLQTLLFYAIVKAVANLRGNDVKIFVYGDDIILPSKLIEEVAYFFENLGFELNLEKSFWEGPFRESCGGDYHSGIDVRPYMPEGLGQTKLNLTAYQALLHKMYNGFLSRWTEWEIPSVVRLILDELDRLGRIQLVMPDDPDESGLKHDISALIEYSPVHRVRFKVKCGPSYKKLRVKPSRRTIRNETAYYWDSLRSIVNRTETTEVVSDSGAFTILDGNIRESKRGSTVRYIWSY